MATRSATARMAEVVPSFRESVLRAKNAIVSKLFHKRQKVTHLNVTISPGAFLNRDKLAYFDYHVYQSLGLEKAFYFAADVLNLFVFAIHPNGNSFYTVTYRII